jgi:hypothetical protein
LFAFVRFRALLQQRINCRLPTSSTTTLPPRTTPFVHLASTIPHTRAELLR